MNKQEAKKRIDIYLKQHNINSRLINDHNRPMRQENLDTFYLFYDVDVPGGIESDIRLYDDKMYVRAYYSETIADECKKSACRDGVIEVINFINANVFFELLYTPRIYLSTDGYCDIAITTVIPYDFFELAPIETLEYITCYYPEYMYKFAIPLCSVICGKMSAADAICLIKKNILNEEDDL